MLDKAQVTCYAVDRREPRRNDWRIRFGAPHANFWAKVQIAAGKHDGLSKRQTFVVVEALVTLLLYRCEQRDDFMQWQRTNGLTEEQSLSFLRKRIERPH